MQRTGGWHCTHEFGVTAMQPALIPAAEGVSMYLR